MKRLIAMSVGLIGCGATLAAEPARPHAPPAATLRAVSATDMTQPLPAAVSTALPPDADYPLHPGMTACGGAGCTNGSCSSCGRTCLEKLTDWFCYRPGPRVLPLCTPVSYQPPLRHYFPCHPGQCLVVGGCRPAAGCGANGCGHKAPGVGHPGFVAAAAPGPMPVPQAAPAPVGAAQGQPMERPARPRFRDRVMGVFSSMWSDPAPYVPFQTPGNATGPTVVPAPAGLRFAAPGMQLHANDARSGVNQAGHQQPDANRPLTRQ